MKAKALDMQVALLEEEKNKLMVENESLRVSRQEIIALPKKSFASDAFHESDEEVK